MENPEKNLSSKLESEESRMEFMEGHPICGKCLSGNHEHPLTNEAREEMRSDCKNVGAVEGKQYQCNCGHGGLYKDKKWESWEEEE